MAENVAEMHVEGTMIGGSGATRNRARMLRIGGIGLIAMLVALLIAGLAMYDRHASPTSVAVAPHVVIGADSRFLENNTTNLPNAVDSDVASPVMTLSQRHFLEVNTMLPVGESYPYAGGVTPLPGHAR